MRKGFRPSLDEIWGSGHLTMDAASEDPADPLKTKRIMTVVLAEDW
jgi:hypothetical protein